MYHFRRAGKGQERQFLEVATNLFYKHSLSHCIIAFLPQNIEQRVDSSKQIFLLHLWVF